MTSVSILVVTWNSAAEIEECLDAALTQCSTETETELVVVDNASADGTPELLAGYRDRAKVMTLDRNLGYAAANNLAAACAHGEHLLLLNPDCTMDPGCLEALRDHLDREPRCAVAAADLRYPDGRPQSFARREVTLTSAWWCLTETGARLDVKLLKGRHRSRRWYDDRRPDLSLGPTTVDAAAAACVLVRGSALVGLLFDERFPLLYNDSDLYRRLRQRGFHADIVPTATATHHYGTGLQQVPEARMRAESVRSLLRYADRWWPRPQRLALRGLLLLDCVCCAALVLLRRRPDAAATALRGTWGGLSLPGGAQPWLT